MYNFATICREVALTFINRLIVGKTVLVIAHRHRTIFDVDNIIVLNQGKLVEEGTGEELLVKGGLFSRLYQIQNQSNEWKLLIFDTGLNTHMGSAGIFLDDCK